MAVKHTYLSPLRLKTHNKEFIFLKGLASGRKWLRPLSEWGPAAHRARGPLLPGLPQPAAPRLASPPGLGPRPRRHLGRWDSPCIPGAWGRAEMGSAGHLGPSGRSAVGQRRSRSGGKQGSKHSHWQIMKRSLRMTATVGGRDGGRGLSEEVMFEVDLRGEKQPASPGPPRTAFQAQQRETLFSVHVP